MFLEDEHLCIIIDTVNNIDSRYTRTDWKNVLLKDYEMYEKKLNENNSLLKIHLTKDYFNYVVKDLDNMCIGTCTKNIIRRRTSVNNVYINNNAYELLRSKLNVFGKRKIGGIFPIHKFYYENGLYIIKIRIMDCEKLKLDEECKVCYEENKYARKNGYFKCNHTIICDDCFKSLSKKCCPYCRSQVSILEHQPT